MKSWHHIILDQSNLSTQQGLAHGLKRSVVSYLPTVVIIKAFRSLMEYVIRQLTMQDEPILWEMLYYGLSSARQTESPARDVVRRPEISRYVEGWGRTGDTG